MLLASEVAQIVISSVHLQSDICVPYRIKILLSIFIAFLYINMWFMLFKLEMCCGLCPVGLQGPVWANWRNLAPVSEGLMPLCVCTQTHTKN